jgi:Tfp pilus assembly protein PilF
MGIRLALVLVSAGAILAGQVADPARQPLEQAYAALQAKKYDAAIELFLEAASQAPERASIRKDLAYTYLKTGDTEAAREQFAEVMRLVPSDLHTALEYAFLCHETGKTAEARHIFNQARATSDPELRATAEQAFLNIDRPLAEGIERWTKAVRADPADFSAHRELATLAERREDPNLAAEHYLQAWRLRPAQRSSLVDAGRVLQAAGRPEEAHAALMAAAWSGETRASEAARQLLPPRYPYVYEFRQAIELDPGNVDLRRELAFLLAAMGRTAESEKELSAIPQPVTEKRSGPNEKSPQEIRELADKSYRAGYLRDALEFYSAAHERNPLDFGVILQLGWTYNVLGQDKQALSWFSLARKSPDPKIAAEAAKAYLRLRPSQARFRMTAWLFPSYSSRWQDMFTYGQVKVEMKLGQLPLRAYASTRFIGDTRQLSNEARPQYLSESSFIPGVGLATEYWHGAMLWAEAGVATSYLNSRRNLPRLAADYRGGIAFNRGFGRLMGSRKVGLFLETNDDGVFISRFQNDFILYSQNRAGMNLGRAGALGSLETLLYWNMNASADARRQYWANTVEMGPGLRFRWAWMPPSWVYSVNFVRGGYTVMETNPRNRMYNDLRIGFWYALTR